MKGTHQGRSWKYYLKKMEQWDCRSDFMDTKRAKQRRKRMYDGVKRKSIYMRDGRKCVDCKKPLNFDEYIIGHVVPLSEGGTNHPKNLVTICRECEDGRHGRARGIGAAPVGK